MVPRSTINTVGAPPLMGGLSDGTRLRIGFIIDCLPISHPQNKSKLCTEYLVDVVERNLSMSRYYGCVALDGFGDQLNWSQVNHRPVTEQSRVKTDQPLDPKSQATSWKHKHGAMVAVLCVEGRKDNAVILGGIQHPAYRLENRSDDPAVQRFDGIGSSGSRDDRVKQLPLALPGLTGDAPAEPTMTGEFNGLRWNINESGEMTVIFQGPKNADGTLKDSQVGPTIMKIDQQGNFFVLDNLDQEIKLNRQTQQITISSGSLEKPCSIVIDRMTGTINIQSLGTGINLMSTGAIGVSAPTINVVSPPGKPGAGKVSINGTLNIEATGDISFKSKGNINMESSGDCNVKGRTVNLN